MKGYVNVPRQDLLSAIIGFQMKKDSGAEIRGEAIARFYEKNYVNGSWFTRWRYKDKTPYQFAIANIGMYESFDDLFYEVLDEKELDLLTWYCYIDNRRADPLIALYKAGYEDDVLVDQDMAKFINHYKDYLESV